MHLNYWLPGSWQELNDQVAEKLQLDTDKTTARVYLGLNHALSEITQGLVKHFPHKKKVYYLKDQSPFLERPMVDLSKEGVNVNALERGINPQEWAADLDKEALFLLHAEDEPLLGQSYDVKVIEDSLKEKRIFRIKISHASFKYEELNKNLDRYEIRILSLAPDLAVALCGSKVKLGSLVASGLKWPPQALSRLVSGFESLEVNKDKVLEFERLKPGQFTPYFSETDSRVYDRCVFYWEDMDGLSVINELALDLGKKLHNPGEDSRFETPSLSRWGGIKTVDWLKAQGIKDKVIRGLVILSADMIDDKLSPRIEMVREKILKKQNG